MTVPRRACDQVDIYFNRFGLSTPVLVFVICECVIVILVGLFGCIGKVVLVLSSVSCEAWGCLFSMASGWL